MDCPDRAAPPDHEPAERPGLPELPEAVTAVEAHPVGELDCGVVVTTAGRVRYFLVRVAEFDHR